MNFFIIIPIGFVFFSISWFAWCSANAGRGGVARVISGISGGIMFIFIQGIIPMIFSEEVRRLCGKHPDSYVIMGIFLISLVIIFFMGLLLRIMLRKPAADSNN